MIGWKLNQNGPYYGFDGLPQNIQYLSLAVLDNSIHTIRIVFICLILIASYLPRLIPSPGGAMSLRQNRDRRRHAGAAARRAGDGELA